MENLRFYYSFLPSLDRKVYNKLAEGIRRCETEIRVTAMPGQVKKILPMVFLDNPQFYYVDTTCFSLASAGMCCNISIGYHKNQAQIRSMTPRLEQIGTRFLEEVARKKLNNLMTVKYVHDFIIRSTAYDQISRDTMRVSGDVSSITGVLFNQSAVCMGIAMTAKWLLDLAGIPSAVVQGHMLERGERPNPGYTGQAAENDHAWNLVCVNDVWQSMDVTMDLGSSGKTRIAYDYFLRSSHTMDAYLQHCPFPVDCSKETGSYFVQNRTIFRREDTIDKYLRYCVQNQKKRIYFTLKGKAALVPEKRVQQIIQRNVTGAYRLRYNDRLAVYDIFYDEKV